MEVSDLVSTIRKSWNQDTCYPPQAHLWTPDNPALGHCAITALVVQDYLNGGILYCKHASHYWNRLATGEEIDLTREQFHSGTRICVDEIRSRAHLLEGFDAKLAATPLRYALLKARVEANLPF
jgi:hypothetical protein